MAIEVMEVHLNRVNTVRLTVLQPATVPDPSE
jgi:hypothetical protein